jgi:hypothetical protein
MAASAGGGNILLLQELLERGDPSFVDELRRTHDAAALGNFARPWYTDRRPASRRFLLEYLDLPFNTYRHEPLVKRLFKLSEAAGDDAAMVRFLVEFDRSIRRVAAKRHRYASHTVDTIEEARSLVALWKSQGFESASFYKLPLRNRYQVQTYWMEEILKSPPGTTMPKGRVVPGLRKEQGRLPDPVRKQLERHQLFSLRTRRYLRRRAWRYFRKLGRTAPDRYLDAISHALCRYVDADVADGIALLDNWGLVHILFHYSPALLAHRDNWRLADGHSLGELDPAPIYERLWRSSPRALANLITGACCRPVRQWAILLARRDLAAIAELFSLEDLFAMLGHDDPELVAFAAELLRGKPGLDRIDPNRWLALVENAGPATLEILCELIERYVDPGRLLLEQAARFAASRPLPVARLGLNWLRSKTARTDEEREALLILVDAQAEPLRPEIVRWLRSQLAAAQGFRADWLLAFLDARHADVRTEGLDWFHEEPRARQDVNLWTRLLESPYDDVRFALVKELEARVAGTDGIAALRVALDPERLRVLWATVLLNIHRGNRSKPVIVRQLVRRIEERPEDARMLLPLLAVALRSVRGPEWRAGLAAVVQLVEKRPSAASEVRSAFPELQGV